MFTDGYQRMYVKPYNLATSCLIFCGVIFFGLIILLINEYHFFSTQAKELLYLQNQYRKTIARIQDPENPGLITNEKKKMNAVVNL